MNNSLNSFVNTVLVRSRLTTVATWANSQTTVTRFWFKCSWFWLVHRNKHCHLSPPTSNKCEERKQKKTTESSDVNHTQLYLTLTKWSVSCSVSVFLLRRSLRNRFFSGTTTVMQKVYEAEAPDNMSLFSESLPASVTDLPVPALWVLCILQAAAAPPRSCQAPSCPSPPPSPSSHPGLGRLP